MTDITWTNDTRRLADLVPWENNPKRMSTKAGEGLHISLDKFGYALPMLIGPNNDLYDGHQRLPLLRSMVKKYGPNATVDVRVSSRPLTDDERRELVVRLKQNQAGWDFDMLPNLYEQDELLNWGFTEEELGMFEDEPQGDDPGPQIDRAEELREKWQVELGQLWLLDSGNGNPHRLICGDCTDAAVVARVMGGEKAQLLFTSPPYWVGKDYETQQSLQEVKEFVQKCAVVWTQHTTKDGGRIIINCSTASAKALNPKADVETLFTLAWWQEAMRQCDWLMRHCRIWLKHGDLAAPRVAARSDVVDQHWETIPEFLPTFYNPDGLRRGQEKIGMKWAQLGVWFDIHGERSADGMHNAAFPLELPERYLRLYTTESEIVLEPFSGSGTTLIACERLGRRCRAVEISPAYCGVAIERWHQMTGREPVLIEP